MRAYAYADTDASEPRQTKVDFSNQGCILDKNRQAKKYSILLFDHRELLLGSIIFVCMHASKDAEMSTYNRNIISLIYYLSSTIVCLLSQYNQSNILSLLYYASTYVCVCMHLHPRPSLLNTVIILVCNQDQLLLHVCMCAFMYVSAYVSN